jgi:hypothetical protein
MTDGTDLDDAGVSGEGEGDSPVVQALRREIKTLKSELKTERESKATAVDDAVKQVQRAVKAREVVNALGFPGLADLAAEKIEGEVTEESASAFIEGLGLKAQAESSGSGGESTTPQGVEGVASLGQRVASAASGSVSKTIEQRLNEASTIEEIEKISREAGFYQD